MTVHNGRPVPSIPLMAPPSAGILRRVERESVGARIRQIDDTHWAVTAADGRKQYAVHLVLGFKGPQLVIRLTCTCQAGFQPWCYHRVGVAGQLGLLDLEKLAVVA